MSRNKNICLFTFLIAGYTACGLQNHNRFHISRSEAEQELKASLSDSTLHNIIDISSIIIKDSATAVGVAEPVLFSIYGKENIVDQRPYDIYHLDHYWVISGTLPKRFVGGTFFIILDATNGEIIRITHGQ